MRQWDDDQQQQLGTAHPSAADVKLAPISLGIGTKPGAQARARAADLAEVLAELIGDDGADILQHLLLVLRASGPSEKDSFLPRRCLIRSNGPVGSGAPLHVSRVARGAASSALEPPVVEPT